MEHSAGDKGQDKREKLHAPASTLHSPETALDGKTRLLARAAIFLIFTQLALSVSLPQEIQAQRVTASEISDLAVQLESMEGRLASIDSEFASLEKKRDKVNADLSLLKEEEAKPKGLLQRLPFMGWRRAKKIGDLFTRSQELADQMSALRRERKPLVEKFIVLADKLIEKSGSRIAVLGETFLSEARMAPEEAKKLLSELSALWALAEWTREARDKYAPGTSAPGDEESFLTLLSEDADPTVLRLWTAAFEEEAASERDKATKLAGQIEDLELRKSQLEWFVSKREDIRRRAEEREITDISISDITGDDNVATEQEIVNIKVKIEEFRARKKGHEEKARNYRQQVEQIKAKLQGKTGR